MPLFTISLDFKGGTYLDQVEAINECEALKSWSRKVDVKSIKYLGPKGKERLIAGVDQSLADKEWPTPITGLKNVWFAFPVVGFFIDIIKTSLDD